MEYIELVNISVEQDEFKNICSDISIPRSCYQQYAHQSVSDLNGKWQCIIIKNIHNTQSLVLYTAGRLFPLYAAIRE